MNVFLHFENRRKRAIWCTLKNKLICLYSMGVGEGFELMLRCLREKKHAAWCAIKVLDFALTDNDTNCQR